MRFLFIAMLFLCLQSKAGVVNIHGGGHGVAIGQRVYLLDLVEHGVEIDAGYGVANVFQLKYPTELLPFLFSRLVYLDGLKLELVRAKINDAASADPVFASALSKAIRNLSWSLTDNDLKMVDPDTVINKPIVQVALRTGSEVLIDRKLWNQMNDDNRVALVVHEAVAALAKPSLKSQQPIRNVVANLFRPDYYSRSTGAQTQNDLSYFPSMNDFATEVGGVSIRGRFFGSSEDASGLRLDQETKDNVASVAPFTDFHLAPTVKTTWINPSGYRQVTEGFLNHRDSLGQTVSIPTCTFSAKPLKKLEEVEIGFYTVELRPMTTRNGYPEPRYAAQYRYHQRARMRINDQHLVNASDCSEDNESELKHMRAWAASFQPL